MHTPGPWQATQSDPAESYHVWWITASPNGRNSEKEICSVSGREEGNACLIAAAPELLATLQKWQALGSTECSSHLTDETDALIAKATRG